MKKSPLILVTTISSKEDVLSVRAQVVLSLVEVGLIPVIVNSSFPREKIADLYGACQGVVIPGGADINPEKYHADVDPKTIPSDLQRDDLEIEIAKRAIKDKKPILGICRGMQIVAVSQGAKLIQHVPNVTKLIHGSSDPKYADLYEEKFTHSISLVEDSLMAKIFSEGKASKLLVPSMHHQSVDENTLIGSKSQDELPLFVSARSADGIVEALELPLDFHPFCLGVQGHPEAWIKSLRIEEKKIAEKLFKEFANAILSFGKKTT